MHVIMTILKRQVFLEKKTRSKPFYVYVMWTFKATFSYKLWCLSKQLKVLFIHSFPVNLLEFLKKLTTVFPTAWYVSYIFCVICLMYFLCDMSHAALSMWQVLRTFCLICFMHILCDVSHVLYVWYVSRTFCVICLMQHFLCNMFHVNSMWYVWYTFCVICLMYVMCDMSQEHSV